MSWLVDTLIATGGLIVLVLVVRGPALRLFGPALAYSLWMLPLLRLLLPPLSVPAAPLEVQHSAAQAGPVITITAAEPLAPAWSFAAPLLQAVWLAGAILFLVWRSWSYLTMRKRLLADARTVGEADGVRLVESRGTVSPVAFGIFDKVVALPPGFMDHPDRLGRDLALRHELEHHAGRDLAVNIAMQPLLALHWFNPLAWAGWRAMRRDQEAACDARVLAGCDARTRADYADLIASFVLAPRLTLAAPLACPVVAEKNIVYRLRSLTMTEPTTARGHLGRMLLGSAVLALPFTATISRAATEDPPAPPAAPQPPAAPAAATASTAPHKVARIVIVEAANPDDKSLHSRTVTRGERTYEFRTKQELSDADVQRRIDAIESGTVVEGSAISVGPIAPGEGSYTQRRVVVVTDGTNSGGGAPAAHAPDGSRREVRTFVVHGDSLNGAPPVPPTPGMAPAQCTDGKSFTARVERLDGDKREVSVVAFCHKGGTPVQSLESLRHARAKVSADTSLAPEVKSEVLRQIDAEIAKLEKEA